MRRRLMSVMAASVLAGAGCALAEAGTGVSSPPTGTTFVPAVADRGGLPTDGHASEESR